MLFGVIAIQLNPAIHCSYHYKSIRNVKDAELARHKVCEQG